MLGSKEAHTINNSGTYDTYKDLCLSEKERKKKLLKSIQSANCLNAWFSEKKRRLYHNNTNNPRKCY